MKQIAFAVFAAVTITLGSGCDTDDRPRSGTFTEVNEPRFTIVTTTGMITDVVRQIAGPDVRVIGLMKEDVDPHLFKPLRSDVVALNDADVVFYNGLGLEGQMETVLESIASDGKPVRAVTNGIDDSELIRSEEAGSHSATDPHVWMSPKLWRQAIAVVVETLSNHDPDHSGEYEQAAEKYLSQMSVLDEYIEQSINSIPEPQRQLVTAHDAFAYFGRRYGIEVKAVQGITTEAEAGVADINRLVDFIVENEIPAVFVETTISPQTVRAMVEGAADRGKQVAIGTDLFSDAMGPTGTYEGTYLGMLDHNATVITRALGGTAPVDGRVGKLTILPESK
ncbi:metal ABC transporter solute-binding protein, Zn/Mn family [Stratiformator vulcanicus]|uniref:Periplasmic zinc-binding protein TroA n=1 Tax=Stratiformator vulcanicus TaxID=2527980 RepID=A0A517QZD0_9PLAN|nr:zinc ABC transporter substrate-binding protein [Stratiformator vulcanicus]QDT36968.1 Periplasmic zinc-binding protein TroA precursor [Stratiformator vulcanicus]